jgi:hypothetical protein
MSFFAGRFIYVQLCWVVFIVLFAGSAALQADSPANTDQKDQHVTQNGEDQPAIFFPQARYEFDTVMEGEEIKHDFIIENHGRAPLIIKNVRPG